MQSASLELAGHLLLQSINIWETVAKCVLSNKGLMGREGFVLVKQKVQNTMNKH